VGTCYSASATTISYRPVHPLITFYIYQSTCNHYIICALIYARCSGWMDGMASIIMSMTDDDSIYDQRYVLQVLVLPTCVTYILLLHAGYSISQSVSLSRCHPFVCLCWCVLFDKLWVLYVFAWTNDNNEIIIVFIDLPLFVSMVIHPVHLLPVLYFVNERTYVRTYNRLTLFLFVIIQSYYLWHNNIYVPWHF